MTLIDTSSFRSTCFLLSAAATTDFPPDEGREVAFVGRSNSGKSSAINAICAQNKLARTSKTPGRTQLINFFTIDESRRLVDLPGYGFARASRAKREEWSKLATRYVETRRSLAGVVMLMDIRHPLNDDDKNLLVWLAMLQHPCCVLLTKADKLKHGAMMDSTRAIAKELSPWSVQTSLSFSAHSNLGVDKAREIIGTWLSA